MKIYTQNEAANIVELFEDVLDRFDIVVPSEEDDDRSEDNDAKLYGMVYWDLLEAVQNKLITWTAQVKNGAEVVTDEWED